ncbi:hypothetical protein SBADM41S_01848 [Streptomyces badius]
MPWRAFISANASRSRKFQHEQIVEQGVVSGGPLDLAEAEVLVVHRRDARRLYGGQVGVEPVVGVAASGGTVFGAAADDVSRALHPGVPRR